MTKDYDFEFGFGTDESNPNIARWIGPSTASLADLSTWWPIESELEETWDFFNNSEPVWGPEAMYTTWDGKDDSFPRRYYADSDNPMSDDKFYCIQTLVTQVVIMRKSSNRHKTGLLSGRCSKWLVNYKEREVFLRANIVDACEDCPQGDLQGEIPGQDNPWKTYFIGGDGAFESSFDNDKDIWLDPSKRRGTGTFNIMNPCSMFNEDGITDRYPPPEDHPGNPDVGGVFIFHRTTRFQRCEKSFVVQGELPEGFGKKLPILRLVDAQHNWKQAKKCGSDARRKARTHYLDLMRCLCQTVNAARDANNDDFQNWINEYNYYEYFNGGIDANGNNIQDYRPNGQGWIDDRTLDPKNQPNNKYLQQVRECFQKMMDKLRDLAIKYNIAYTDDTLFPAYPAPFVGDSLDWWKNNKVKTGDRDDDRDINSGLFSDHGHDQAFDSEKGEQTGFNTPGYANCPCREYWRANDPGTDVGPSNKKR